MKINSLPLVIIMLMICVAGSRAQQGLYNAGGLLHTNKNSILHVAGEIQNQAGSIQNDGVIELTGNFTNDSVAMLVNGADSTSTERAYKFIGAGTQLIKGNISDSAVRYFYNLVIDKAASASAVQLYADSWVKGALVYGSATTGAATYAPTANSTLTNNNGQGIIATYDSLNNDYELYITNSAVNALAGYAALMINASPTDGFIVNRGAQGVGLGGFARNVSKANATYVFPVGTTLNGYNATAMTFTSLPATDKVRGMFVDATGGVGSLSTYCNACSSGTGEKGMNYYFSANPCNNNTGQWVILNALPSDHGYWSYAGSDSDVYQLAMYPNSFTAFGGAAEATWRMIKKSGSITIAPTGDWTAEIISDLSKPADLLTYTTNTNCYTGTGVPGGMFTGFASFQMIRSMSNTALPVSMVSLTAQPEGDKYISIQWATASETNDRGFAVMRSADGTDFSSIGWVDAQDGGNSATLLNYSYNDHTALPNVTYYYKLSQEDDDGDAKETYMVDARLSGSGDLVVLGCMPNPATTQSSVSITSSQDIHLLFELYTILGQLVYRNNIDAPAGISQYSFPTDKLPEGIYLTVVRSDAHSFVNTLNIIK
jgi:hypothetical protein